MRNTIEEKITSTLLARMQSQALDKPRVQCGISTYHSLVAKGVYVDWRGKVQAPEGAVDGEGCVALPPATKRGR